MQRKRCVCVCDRDNTRNTKNEKIVSTRSKNEPMVTREGDGDYVVIFSLSSLTSTASWERGGVLTTY